MQDDTIAAVRGVDGAGATLCAVRFGIYVRCDVIYEWREISFPSRISRYMPSTGESRPESTPITTITIVWEFRRCFFELTRCVRAVSRVSPLSLSPISPPSFSTLVLLQSFLPPLSLSLPSTISLLSRHG